MAYDGVTIIWLIVVVFLGGAMQSAVGFAYALFATPFLILIGIPLPSTVAIVATCSLVQSIFGATRLRAQTPWRVAAIALVVRLIATAAGIFGLRRMALLPPEDIRLIVGIVLCALVALQWFIRPKPVDRLHPAWGGLAFVGSGLLSGLVGMGGPPLVLWAMAHSWSNEKTRGFLFAVFMASLPVHLVMLYVTFGHVVLLDVLTGLMLAPAVILGSLIGMAFGNRISRASLQTLAYGILFILGLGAALPRIIGLMY